MGQSLGLQWEQWRVLEVKLVTEFGKKLRLGGLMPGLSGTSWVGAVRFSPQGS